MTRYGVVEVASGKVVVGDLWSEEEAQGALAEHLTHGGVSEAFEVEELCDDHPDRAAAWCERCN